MTQSEPVRPPPRGRGGRRRDASRDVAIADAALQVLAERGYDAMTMSQVAQRAGASKATMYLRWATKADLLIHAVSRIGDEPSLEDLPDTGTLRGDLIALMQPMSQEENDHLLAITSGLASLLSADPALADAAATALVEPFVASQRLLMTRAKERGEIAGAVDIETIAFVTPSMTAFRLIVQRRPIDVDYIHLLVDTVVLPAVGLASRGNL